MSQFRVTVGCLGVYFIFFHSEHHRNTIPSLLWPPDHIARYQLCNKLKYFTGMKKQRSACLADSCEMWNVGFVTILSQEMEICVWWWSVRLYDIAFFQKHPGNLKTFDSSRPHCGKLLLSPNTIRWLWVKVYDHSCRRLVYPCRHAHTHTHTNIPCVFFIHIGYSYYIKFIDFLFLLSFASYLQALCSRYPSVRTLWV